jgi:hypothetical protein
MPENNLGWRTKWFYASGRVDMDPHYAAYKATADCIVRQIITESDRQRVNQGIAAH